MNNDKVAETLRGAGQLRNTTLVPPSQARTLETLAPHQAGCSAPTRFCAAHSCVPIATCFCPSNDEMQVLQSGCEGLQRCDRGSVLPNSSRRCTKARLLRQHIPYTLLACVSHSCSQTIMQVVGRLASAARRAAKLQLGRAHWARMRSRRWCVHCEGRWLPSRAELRDGYYLLPPGLCGAPAPCPTCVLAKATRNQVCCRSGCSRSFSWVYGTCDWGSNEGSECASP